MAKLHSLTPWIGKAIWYTPSHVKNTASRSSSWGAAETTLRRGGNNRSDEVEARVHRLPGHVVMITNECRDKGETFYENICENCAFSLQ